MFFECSLPEKAPDHLHWSVQADFEKVSARIRSRTEKLQDALTRSGMKPETFQVLASELFKREERLTGKTDRFDAMSGDDLISCASSLFLRDEDYERLVFPNADVLFDTAFATVKEWESVRRIGIGGSDAAAAEGISCFRPPLALFHDKTASPVRKKSTAEKNPVLERGHIMEDTVIGTYCALTGAVRIRDTRMFRSRSCPHCIADIDAVLRMPDGTVWLFEAKTSAASNAPAWRNNAVPPWYETQIRHYLGVLDDPDVKGVHIGCLFLYDLKICGTYAGSQYDASRFVSRDIRRDPEREKKILERNEQFWSRYIETGIQPPFTGGEKEKLLADSLAGHADPSLPAADLTTSDNLDAAVYYSELSSRIGELRKEAETLDDERKSIQTDFIAQLGPRTEGRIRTERGYYEIRYAPSRRMKTDLEKLEAAYPDAYASCVSPDPDPPRRFSLKEHG